MCSAHIVIRSSVTTALLGLQQKNIGGMMSLKPEVQS